MKTIKIAQTEANDDTRDRFAELLRRALPDLILQQYSNAEALIRSLRTEAFDCILLNTDLPGINGLNVLRQIRLAPGHRYTPVVILSPQDDSRTAVRAIKLGANDYLAEQSTSLDLLRQTILSAISSGEQAQALDRQQQQLKVQALTDPLTSLHNRRAFTGRLDSLVTNNLSKTKAFALIMIDLNHFKRVNDKFGHEAGDHVLSEMANRLRQITRSDDSVFRIGGDEFVVIIDNNPSEADATRLAKRLHDNMRNPVLYQDQECYPGGGSIGWPCFRRMGSARRS